MRTRSAFRQLFFKQERTGGTSDLHLETVQEALSTVNRIRRNWQQITPAEEAVMEATGMNAPSYDRRPKVLTT